MTRGSSYDGLVASRKVTKDRTRAAILEAMKAIERDVAEHGFYPNNDGKVTLSEVLVRAGVGATTLRNKHHHETRELVQTWISKISAAEATTKPRARRAAREKIQWYEDALKRVNAEALKWRTERAALINEIEDLRAQIQSIKASIGSNVVGINANGDKSRRD